MRVETPNADDPTDFWGDCRLHLEAGIQCHFPKWERELGEWPNMKTWNTCHHYKYNAGTRKAPHAWHLPLLCDFGTVVTVAIQIAVLLEYEEIYLVGCDLGYERDVTHFYDSSSEQRQPPEQANANILLAHQIARKYSPVPIYNATIGGALEVYPRVAIEELMK